MFVIRPVTVLLLPVVFDKLLNAYSNLIPLLKKHNVFGVQWTPFTVTMFVPKLFDVKLNLLF